MVDDKGLEAALRAHFEAQHGHAIPTGGLKLDSPLFGLDGVLDSLAILDLVSFLEAEFGFQVAAHELGEAHFGTLAGLITYVDSRRG
jgi:acyl carrier protein